MTKIVRSELLDDGVCVWFDKWDYYAHGIRKIGMPKDKPGGLSMWAWINHMRSKNWWSGKLENSFIKEVEKYIPYGTTKNVQS